MKKWHASSAGPDWTDVVMYLSALDKVNGTTSWLDLSAAGSTLDIGWRVFVVSVLPAVYTPEQVHRVVTEVQWPNVDSADFASAIYKALVSHDYEVSKASAVQQGLQLT